MKRQFVSTLVMMSSMMGLAACGGGSSNQFISAPSSGTGGGTGGVVSSTGIYITVADQTQSVVTSLHQFYNYGTPCTIASGAASQDIQCLLNIRELDLFQQGLKFEFNVPAGMCDYIGDSPYWYFNRQAGYGPKAVSVTVNDATSTGSCTYTNNSGTTVAGVISGHDCTFPGGSVAVEGTTTCAYDYSADGGPNCCEGLYALTTTYTDASGTKTTTFSPKKDWGGKIGKCAAGPFLESDSGWTFNSTSGYPYQQIRTGAAGFNSTYKIKAPITMAYADNTYAANFWDWTSYAAGSLSAAALPLPLSYNSDKLGNTLPVKANNAYTFYCYDTAMEVKHRVRLYINEWDVSSQFLTYIGSDATARAGATPDAVSTATCDITNDVCDDIPGWNYYKAVYPLAFPNHDFGAR